ncbi:MAG: 16S rRNA (uracil(1498)-N(3))-methyltransferase [Streptosporangiaceae bacterium]
MFVCDPARLGLDRITLDGAEGRHATTVRRIAPGERVDLTDGGGLVAECVAVAARPGVLELTVLSRRTEPEPSPRVVVVQAIIKGDRGELAVELMTEVGADEIVPWSAERCVARWRPDREEKALGRWRSTAVAAAKQSRRGRFPVVCAQQSLPAVLERVSAAALAVTLDPAAPVPLGRLSVPAAGELVLIVGPEGGISPAEEAALAAAGAVPARLGPSVLRGSTAGAVAAAVLLSGSDRWT